MNLVRQLNPDFPSSEIVSALATIRNLTKSDKKVDVVGKLIDDGLVARLVALLTRPNSKVVDLALSALANLFLSHDSARREFGRVSGSGSALLGVLANIGEEAILCRAARAVANLQHSPAEVIDGLLERCEAAQIVVRTLASSAKSAQTKSALTRAIRTLSNSPRQKGHWVKAKAVEEVAKLIADNDNESLLKSSLKCLAHFTHGSSAEESAAQIANSTNLQRIVDLAQHESTSIFQSALATLINLSYVDTLRSESFIL